MKDENKSEELAHPKQDVSADLSVFIPTVERWIASQENAATLQHDIEKEEIHLRRELNKKSFRLLWLVVLGVFLISGGIIFYIKNLEAGLLVLSHVGAIVAGLLAGMGFEKTTKSSDE